MCQPASLILLLFVVASWQSASADLVRVDLSSAKAWRLTNANNSINLPTAVPAHTLSVLSSAGVIAADPLSRYGELDTRWVGQERWNFTLLWPSKRHELLAGCRQVLLVLHGIDTHATVVLNGRHVLRADNAHRSWWLPLSGPDVLREGANMLSVVLHPAVDMAARAKLAYPYPVPTMQVPGGVGSFNFIRKPAYDMGWDWGPAFVPVGLTGGVELVGFDRATLIGALVSQQFNSSSNTFDLTATAQFVVPAGGDNGTLSLTLATLELQTRREVVLQPGTVGGNQLQALVTMSLQVPADRVTLWQPLTLAPKGTPRELYDLAVMFEPTVQPASGSSSVGATCGVAPAPAGKKGAHRGSESKSDRGSGSSGEEGLERAPEPDIRSVVVRRIGFRTVELVREPVQAAARELLAQPGTHSEQRTLQQQQQSAAALQDEQAAGESFYFRVNGVPLFAKGANLIPLHVLSTAVTEDDVQALLQSAVDANMNTIRIWGGGRYQMDKLYDAADELGLMVWQEAMFACSPYPRNAGFLSNVEAEVTQQLLRIGSHASMVVFGGNNEVEQSLDWYEETVSNVAMYAADYSALFEHTIAPLVQKMLPGTPWVDSSPSKGSVWLPDAPRLQQRAPAAAPDPVAASAAPELDPVASNNPAGGQHVKRWGDTNDPLYGDVHFYNYLDDCQDWSIYPHARFVSEYGWQSYPTWSTYAAATAEEDWQVTSDMTEFRQRHPNGTVELLAQLQRRFKLPQAWLDLLPQPEQQTAQQPQDPFLAQAAAQEVSLSRFVSQAWRSSLQLAAKASAAVHSMLVLHRPSNATDSTPHPAQRADSSVQWLTEKSGNGLVPGRWVDGDKAAASSSSVGACSDMQHFVYLTQLQQMLCYETAFHTWRRLRSDPATLSMGVLYWQLNDVWAGASWSSVDYGGVWKPVHYGVARAFADVTLSVQHDLQGDTISVYAVNDLQEPVGVRLAVRLLSVTDTQADCPQHHSTGTGSPASSLSNSVSSKPSQAASGSSSGDVLGAAPYVKHHQRMHTAAPAGAAVLLWSETVASLLRNPGTGCSRSSCYVHIALEGEGHPHQEATVWLAPFKELPLADPQLAVGDMQVAKLDTTAGLACKRNQEAVNFTVTSQAVAAYAVWETQGGELRGHFSDNALTIHPCEPRQVTFLPRGVGAAETVSRGDSAARGSHSRGRQQDRGGGAGRQVLQLLQEQLLLSSLWDHQQFGEQQQQQEEKQLAVL